MKKFNKTAFAIVSSIIASANIGAAHAEANPFSISDLSSGYMNVAEAASNQEAMGKMKEASCEEGKCGANKANTAMKKSTEGKCGEAKCGANKSSSGMEKSAEGKCGFDKMTMGKIAEGSCGGMMKTMSGWFE